ncbi:MAG: hypothetical protein ACK54A_14835 [Sphingobacteriales bacterium]|jgi:hypothetical protein
MLIIKIEEHDALEDSAFKNKEWYDGRTMFIANSLIDSDDPQRKSIT